MSIPCTSGAAVCQLHVALGLPGNLRVSFVGSAAFSNQTAVVEWGFAAQLPLPKSVLSSTVTYKLQDLCAPIEVRARGWEDPGLQHHAELPGALLGGADVYYRVGYAGTAVWSNVTGPVAVAGAAAPRLAIFGDMGTYEYAPSDVESGGAEPLGAVDISVAGSLARAAGGLHAILHVGDLAYAHDGPSSRWRYWFDEIEPVAATTPWMVGCGNHDCLWGLSRQNPHGTTWERAIISAGGDGGQCGVSTDARFWMPGDSGLIAGWEEARGGTRNNLFYSFELGAVHISVISSEHDLSDGSVQRRWLESDLRAVDRARTPFVLLGLHRPIYTSTQGGSALPETAGLRASLEPLLVRYRVTLVVAGHYHQYERSCRLAGGACVPSSPSAAANGTVHVTAGIGGLQHHEDWLSPTPSWVEAQNTSAYGYLVLEVANATHARVQAIDATHGDEAFDDFWLLA